MTQKSGEKTIIQDAHNYMKLALEEARLAGERGEVPVGAVLVGREGEILARNGNRSIECNDPCGHAEIEVMRAAGKLLGNYRLTGTTLYVTLEPCLMCAAAMIHARIGRVVFGTTDPKGGGLVSLYTIGNDRRLNHSLEVEGGILTDECAAVLQDFFRRKRSRAETT